MLRFILVHLAFAAAVSAQGYKSSSSQVYGVGSPSVTFQQKYQRPIQQTLRPNGPIGYPPSTNDSKYQYRPVTPLPGYIEQRTSTPYNYYLLTTTQEPTYYRPPTTVAATETYGHGRTASTPSYGPTTAPSTASQYESRLIPSAPPSQIEYQVNYSPTTTVDYEQQPTYGQEETTTRQPNERPSNERRRYPPPPPPYIHRRRPSSVGSYSNERYGPSLPYNTPSGPSSIYSSNERSPYQNERPRGYGFPPIPVTPSPYAVNGGGRPYTEASRPGVATYAPAPPPGVGRIEGIIGPNALVRGTYGAGPRVVPPYASEQGNREYGAAGPPAALPFHPEFGYPYYADDSNYYFRVPGVKLRKYIQAKN